MCNNEVFSGNETCVHSTIKKSRTAHCLCWLRCITWHIYKRIWNRVRTAYTQVVVSISWSCCRTPESILTYWAQSSRIWTISVWPSSSIVSPRSKVLCRVVSCVEVWSLQIHINVDVSRIIGRASYMSRNITGKIIIYRYLQINSKWSIKIRHNIPNTGWILITGSCIYRNWCANNTFAVYVCCCISVSSVGKSVISRVCLTINKSK